MTDEQLRAWAAQSSSFLDLVIRPEDLDGVIANLSVLYGHAKLVLAVPLPQTVESTSVFQP
jgi:hypothetical protein